MTMAWWKGKFLARVMLMWVLDEVFIGYYGGLCLTWSTYPGSTRPIRPDERPGVSGFTDQNSSATSSVLVAPSHRWKDW
ncbi:hypothetical protein [Micromonospora sp. NPDC050200]|uniref:hypothetical protein n=1 Tax=Micromonospora sp. NPDC050200 TaxID=3155664 RepID=UPI0033DB7A36